jgi:hypothetical protein
MVEVMDDSAIEYACRSRLKWKRDGADWVLWDGRRRMGRVGPAGKPRYVALGEVRSHSNLRKA